MSPPFDESEFDSLHAEDFVDESSAGRPATRAGFRAGLVDFMTAFPDVRTRLQDIVVDASGHRAAVRWSARGTHRRRYAGFGPAHRAVDFTGIDIVEIAGERIVRRWGEWDASGLARAHEAFVNGYLRRIGAEPDATLAQLHKAHLCAVPFENLSIFWKQPIVLEPSLLYAKIVEGGRGGFCYELNGLFAELLLALGYRVERLAARVYREDGSLGIPFDHMCLRVNDSWLVDVGFGDNFVEPLRLDREGDQSDGRRTFRVVADGPGAFILLDEGKPSYQCELAAHELAAFTAGCQYHASSPDSSFTQRTVVSRLTADGRITLRGDRWIETRGREKREHTIDPSGWAAQLASGFGIARAGEDDEAPG